MHKNSIPVNIVLLKRIKNGGLSPEEIAVYLTAKLLIVRYDKKPSVTMLEDILGSKVKYVILKMKKKGLLPKGRLDFSKIDARIRNADASKVDLAAQDKRNGIRMRDNARVVIMYLVDHLKRLGSTKLTNTWFALQMKYTLSLLARNKDVSVEEWKSCMDWIFKQTYLAPHCTTMFKVVDYHPRYQMRDKARAANGNKRMNSEHSHEDFWKESVM